MKVYFLLLALGAFQALALISSETSGDELSSVVPGPDELENPDIDLYSQKLPKIQHEKRETRDKCSPQTYNGDEKRDVFLDVQDLNTTLDRRMELPPGTSVKVMNEWMREEMKDDLFGSIIWEKKVNGEPQDMATSVFEEFEDEVFSLGTGFLCGCTTLVIISRKAVYIGHYWENISFSPDKVWLDLYKTSEAAFKRTVINGLTVGVGRGTYPEQVSLKGQKHRIQDSYLHAYLMIPSDNSEGYEDGYRDKWEQIKEIVNGILPDLSTGDRWTEVKYKPLLKDSKLLENTARGRILFKYDPNHNGKKKTALWIEQNATPYHDDEW